MTDKILVSLIKNPDRDTGDIFDNTIGEDLFDKVRKSIPELIGNEIIAVQPMSSNTFVGLFENAKSKKELINGGYKPVSNLGLMWIKK